MQNVLRRYDGNTLGMSISHLEAQYALRSHRSALRMHSNPSFRNWRLLLGSNIPCQRQQLSTAGLWSLNKEGAPPNKSLQVHKESRWAHPIYISTSTNPYFNLSLEDMLFRCHDQKNNPLLFIYRNEPCVVIGRNQNPWKEVNLSMVKRTGIPFIRRRSGGGTVYHDLGNTNFSIHLPRTEFDRHVTAQIILRAVRSLNIDANINDRNDICVGTDKMRSAYKIVNKRAYHHGTMLVSTRLDTLHDLLRVKNKETMITKGVASVRSPVCNLQQYNPNVSHEAFTDAVVKEFNSQYAVHVEPCLVSETEELKNDPEIQKGMAELSIWDWAYGQTPEFTYTIQKTFSWGHVIADIRSKHGIILDCTFAVNTAHHAPAALLDSVARFGKSLVGTRYGFSMEMDKGFEDNFGCLMVPDGNDSMIVKDIQMWFFESSSSSC